VTYTIYNARLKRSVISMKSLMQDTSGTGMLLQLHMQELKQE